jgi:hypothetical protein
LSKLRRESGAQVRFALPSTNVSLELKCQVAWADGTGHVGLRFVEVPQSSQYELDKWLTGRLQEEMPARLQDYIALR